MIHPLCVACGGTGVKLPDPVGAAQRIRKKNHSRNDERVDPMVYSEDDLRWSDVLAVVEAYEKLVAAELAKSPP